MLASRQSLALGAGENAARSDCRGFESWNPRALRARCGQARKVRQRDVERLGIPVQHVHPRPRPSAARTSSAQLQRPRSGCKWNGSVAGAHINAIGANHAHKRELDDEESPAADIIVVDSVEQSRQEAGDLIIAFHGDEICWTGVKKFSEIVAGRPSGRDQRYGKSHSSSRMGLRSWDLAVAMKVYVMARRERSLAGFATME